MTYIIVGLLVAGAHLAFVESKFGPMTYEEMKARFTDEGFSDSTAARSVFAAKIAAFIAATVLWPVMVVRYAWAFARALRNPS